MRRSAIQEPWPSSGPFHWPSPMRGEAPGPGTRRRWPWGSTPRPAMGPAEVVVAVERSVVVAGAAEVVPRSETGAGAAETPTSAVVAAGSNPAVVVAASRRHPRRHRGPTPDRRRWGGGGEAVHPLEERTAERHPDPVEVVGAGAGTPGPEAAQGDPAAGGGLGRGWTGSGRPAKALVPPRGRRPRRR